MSKGVLLSAQAADSSAASSTSLPPAEGKLYFASGGLLLALCLFLSYEYTLYWTLARLHPFAIEYEGHVLWACFSLSQGLNIYDPASLNQGPWSVVIYNPLYFAVGAFLLKLFGTAFAPLRMLSMASALVGFLSFGLLLKRARLSDFITILAVAGFASLVPVLHWSSVARVDFLGLAFAIVSMERFVRYYTQPVKSQAPELSYSSILFSLCAFFCKQQYIVFIVAQFLFAFSQGEKRLALRYFSLWSAFALIGASMLQALTGGYFAHLSYACGLPWEWQTLKLFLLPFLFDARTIVALVVIVFANSRLGRRDTTDQSSRAVAQLPTILLVVSVVVALYSMGLRGAFHNHLLCAEFALFWLMAQGLSRLPLAFSAATLVSILVSITPILGLGCELAERTDRRDETAHTINLLQSLGSKKALVLTEDPSLAIFAEAKPAMVDATTILNMACQRGENQQDLLDSIARRDYLAVIINTHDAEEHRGTIWRRHLVEAIRNNYRLVGRSGGNGMGQSVFLPMPRKY